MNLLLNYLAWRAGITEVVRESAYHVIVMLTSIPDLHGMFNDQVNKTWLGRWSKKKDKIVSM